ncbi:MAG: polymer-forming cytoskeletal protein [Parcubacteria group bacterium]
MFKSNAEERENANGFAGADDTVIGNSIKIEGDMVSNGSIVVEGEVIGSLKTEKNLTVGEKAKIVADVSAKEAFISGKVQGNIKVQDKLELAASAEVNGDISASVLKIDAGAVFNGKCSMTESAPLNVTKEQEE